MSALVRRQVPLTALLIFAALVCWIVAARRMEGMDMGPRTELGSLPFFLGTWVTMMAAMMLPAVLPVVLLVARASRASTGGFVASYLVVWSAYGLLAYAVYRLIRAASLDFLAWDEQGPLIAGAAVAAAGLYELTPLKRACLRHCRSPLSLFARWRPGLRGALSTGVRHGAYCVGCCWGLMIVLFAVGVMSIPWMLVLAAVIFAQKVLPYGDRAERPLSVALVVLGIWVAAQPL